MPVTGAPERNVTDVRRSDTGVPSATTRVLVLRHGQSEWNALGRWQGQADPPLTALGEQQARIAGRLLASECPPFDAVVTSDLDRARVTGETIAGIIGCSVRRLDPRWRENHAGEWQGLTREQIRREWPGYLESDQRPPGFETAESTLARSLAALDSIASGFTGGCVLVVSHGGVLRLLHDHLGGPEQRFPNLSGCWFERDTTVMSDGSTPAPDTNSPWRLGSLLFPLQVKPEDLNVAGSIE
jgi:probable phosphoglycerate mutase